MDCLERLPDMAVERPWFVQVQTSTVKDAEKERQYWEQASGVKTSIQTTDSHTKFVFDASKPIKK